MQEITNSIEMLHAMTEVEPLKIFDALVAIEPFVKMTETDSSDLAELYIKGHYEQASIIIVRRAYPNARYGFDYVPTNKPNKDGKDTFAQGWVRIYSDKKEFNPIDWSVSHKFASIAMLIALLHAIQSHQAALARNAA